jgi:hypothetical protein
VVSILSINCFKCILVFIINVVYCFGIIYNYQGNKEMTVYKQITFFDHFVQVPLKPCPWCKKTPYLSMPLDQTGSKEYETWVWKVYCECKVSSEAKISIRNTSKTNLSRFLDKVDELFNKWNEGNPIKAYEKKVLDLKMIPNLGMR